MTREYNFDGLVGPTHNYAGLAYGNQASMLNRSAVSNPKAAALQGLNKMKFLYRLGVPQCLIPPQERPNIPGLRTYGFDGSDKDVLAQAYKDAPRLLAAQCSASSMWTANAATVSPSVDCADGRVHITPANLIFNGHRAIEAPRTSTILKKALSGRAFIHHNSLEATANFSDEGAANHLRLTPAHSIKGIEIFVYGRSGLEQEQSLRFPTRQALEASQANAGNHSLDTNFIIFARQHPAAIEAGVFHNDVISMSNENVLILHEQAFENQHSVIHKIRSNIKRLVIPLST